MKKTIAILLSVLFLNTALAKDKNPFADFDMSDSGPSGSSGDLYPIHPRGAVGLFHTYSALKQPASTKSFGIGFMGNYYVLSNDFPTTGLITERFDGGFYFNYTPIEYLELFSGISVVTTNNEAPTNPLIRQIPNFDYGLKFSLPIARQFHVGLVYHGEHRGTASNVAGSGTALNHDVLAVGTYDLTDKLPIRLHLNAGYRIDNNIRVSNVGADARVINITRAYPDNSILAALGVEYLLRWALLSLEYSMEMISGGSFAQNPQRVSIGSRFYPTADKAFGLTVGADIGTSGANAATAGVYKEATYSIYFGLNYLFGVASGKKDTTFSSDDVFSQPAKGKQNPTPIATSSKGKILGFVTNIETGDPIAGATIQVCGGSKTKTDMSGSFDSELVPEGPCALTITHPNFQTLQDQVNITGGVDSPFDFGLLKKVKQPQTTSTPQPTPVASTQLMVSAKDQNGKNVPALVYFANDRERPPLTLSESSENTFDLEAGPYELFAMFKGVESQTKYILLKEGEEKYVEFGFSNKPKKVKISKDKKRIEISEKIQFEVGKAMLTYNSKKLVEEIASVMNQYQNIELLEIAGHTDSIGDATYNLKLSQSRADAVKKQLIGSGVDESRLRAVGYGEDFPIADNNTEDGKYQNRRVEFRILKRK